MDNWRIKQLFELLEDDPEDEFVNFAIAQEYKKTGNLELAIQYFLKLKSINENYVGLYYHLADSYVRIDDEINALQTYDEGIMIAQRMNDLHALGELKNAKINYELEL